MSDTILMRKKKGLREFALMFAFTVLILVLVTLLYHYEPFPEYWNELLSNFFTIFVAGFSAAFATLVFRRYEPSDTPRMVWTQLAIGLWLWTLAEYLWPAYAMIFGESRINIADLFWVGAYGFFSYAVYLQYQIMFRPTKRQNVFWASLWMAFAALLTILIAWALVTFVDEDRGLPLWVASFYPAADFAVGLAALRIVHRFHGGALGYPWLGLFVFAIADMLYAVLDMGGFYTWSASAGDALSMISDITYIGAYLFVGLGCFAQLLLLRYGPIFTITRKEIKKTT